MKETSLPMLYTPRSWKRFRETALGSTAFRYGDFEGDFRLGRLSCLC